jgi:hypothetical protein
MPRSADDRSELFARALEGAAADRPATDDELARELAIVQMLVDAGPAAGPDDAARHRMRERVLAGFDAAQAAGTHVAPAVSLAQRRRDKAHRRRGAGGVHARLLGAAAAALCLLLSLSGMSLVLARDALPGDALYGVKRSAESAELGFTFGDQSRGFKLLQFATARVDEIEALAARAGGTPSAEAGRFLTALQAFDTDATAGARLLIESVTNATNATEDTGDQLAALSDWAVQQKQRLAAARPAMPSRAESRADASMELLQKVADRAGALQQRLPCQNVTSGGSDEMGPTPATGACAPATSGAPSPPVPQGLPGQPARQEPPAGGLVIPQQRNPGAAPAAPVNPLEPLNQLDAGQLNPVPALPSGPGQARQEPAADAPSESTVLTVPVPVELPLTEPSLPSLTDVLGVPGSGGG